ncbi:aspartate/glutamate racemase family protein [Ornithinimicrobium sp. Y1847]|uniref:aspartate/glutamate racemase family protein n=1 Tax=Ornithinimicrobium sp. Y1847 TaxID=3405419 RepID=UPI003B683C48
MTGDDVTGGPGPDDARSASRMPPARLLPDTWRRPVLGVLGGMGPAATVAFLDALERATPAARDQDHLDTVILNHSTTPDRTARLHDASRPDPTPYLIGDLELLARLGADRAVILCNTAHAFLDEDALPLPLLSLIRVGAQAAVDVARASGSHGTPVTVLATDGTLSSRLYQDALTDLGAEVRVPDPEQQRRVMAIIYDHVKAGVPVPREEFAEFVEEMRGGSGTVLLGCTELSVLYDQAIIDGHPLPEHVVDAQAALVTRVLAES